MRKKIREWADDIVPSARYGLFEWAWLGFGYPVVLAAAQAYWAFWKEAEWPMKILTAIGLLTAWWGILLLWRWLAPKSVPRLEQAKRSVSVRAPERQFTADPESNRAVARHPIVIEIENTGILTLRNIRVKVVKFDGPAALRGSWGARFPCPLSRHSLETPDLNPGDTAPYALFTQVAVKEAYDKKRVMVQLASQGCHVFLELERDYPITIQVTADDMPKFEQDFFVKFSSDRSYCEFMLITPGK